MTIMLQQQAVGTLIRAYKLLRLVLQKPMVMLLLKLLLVIKVVDLRMVSALRH